MTPTISVIHLTRENVVQANKSLESLYFSAKNKEILEFIVLLDEDDQESLSYFSEKLIYSPRIIKLKRRSYNQFAEYMNEGAAYCSGEWIVLWTDDQIMLTQGWDNILSLGCETDLLYSFYDVSIYGRARTIEADDILMCAVSKEWLKIIGCVAPYGPTDTFLTLVAFPLGIVSRQPKIYAYHWGMDEPYFSRSQLARRDLNPVKFPREDILYYQNKLRVSVPLKRRVRIFIKNIVPNLGRFGRLISARLRSF